MPGTGSDPRLLIGRRARRVSREELIRRADPVLAMLVEETGETAVISRRIGLAAVCLHQYHPSHALRVALEPGVADSARQRRDRHTSSSPSRHPTCQDEVLGPPRCDAEALQARAGSVVARRGRPSEGEVISGTVTIAVPVMRDDGIVAALAVTGPDGSRELGMADARLAGPRRAPPAPIARSRLAGPGSGGPRYFAREMARLGI